MPYQVFEPVFRPLVQTGYTSPALTPSGLRQVDSLAVFDPVSGCSTRSVAPGRRQPDHQFEAALQHVTDAIIVQQLSMKIWATCRNRLAATT